MSFQERRGLEEFWRVESSGLERLSSLINLLLTRYSIVLFFIELLKSI